MIAVLDYVAEEVWAVTRPQSFLGLQLGTRMTLVRLSDGGLLVHSPVMLDDALRAAIDDLGPVRHIVAPNLYHHLHAASFAAAYPDAQLHGAPGLPVKRKDLRFASVLWDEPNPGWTADLYQVPIYGSLFYETVFVHRRSRTLLLTDLIENFSECQHWPTRMYLRMSGLHGKPAVAHLARLAYQDKTAARAAVNRLLTCDVERIVPCHGDLISYNASGVLREAFAWL